MAWFIEKKTNIAMNVDEKLSKLSALSEKSLRESVLVPLLSRMGFRSVTVYHGPPERGKDIVCFDYDRLHVPVYMAVVAKATDLDGSVSSSASLLQALHQIEQCFDVKYLDLFGMRAVTMDRVWVVTSKRIVPGAAESVYSTLEKRNLSKVVRFVSGAQLVDLLDSHYPAYWDASTEPSDVLIDQRAKLLLFARKMLSSLGGSGVEIDSTLNEVLLSASPPRILVPPDRTLTRLSPYTIEIDTIADGHSHNFFSPSCDSIKDAFFESKKELFYSMIEVEEIVEHYEKVITISDPVEFVKEFNKHLAKDFPFFRASYGRAADALRAIGMLEEGLVDIELLRKRLQQIDKLDWATGLVDSVGELTSDIESFMANVDRESFVLHWQIQTVDGRGRLRLLYDQSANPEDGGFITKHERLIVPWAAGDGRQSTPKTLWTTFDTKYGCI
jgi:hypothetical protein